MKQTVNFDGFASAFAAVRPDNFSCKGLRALFEYLEEYEESTGEELEFDVIELCCDFTEYESLDEFHSEYRTGHETLDDIADRTTLIRVDTNVDDDGKEDGRFIVQCF